MPTSISDWLQLPELELPAVNDPDRPGRVYRLESVRIATVHAKPSLGVDHDPSREEAGQTLDLPVVTVMDDHGRPVSCRVPWELTGWVVGCLSIAAEMDERLFPAEVEFGRLGGDGACFARFSRRRVAGAVH